MGERHARGKAALGQGWLDGQVTLHCKRECEEDERQRRCSWYC